MNITGSINIFNRVDGSFVQNIRGPDFLGFSVYDFQGSDGKLIAVFGEYRKVLFIE